MWSSTPKCRPLSACRLKMHSTSEWSAKPPDFFRPQGGRLRRGRQITLGRILTERCEANSCQQKQGKSEVTLHLNEPTMVPTVAHADGRSFLGPVVITAHLKPTRCQSASFIAFASSNNLPSVFLLPYNKSDVPSQRMPNRSSRLTRMSDRQEKVLFDLMVGFLW